MVEIEYGHLIWDIQRFHCGHLIWDEGSIKDNHLKMGRIADVSNMALGFIVPLACFGFIVYFGLSGYKARTIN